MAPKSALYLFGGLKAELNRRSHINVNGYFGCNGKIFGFSLDYHRQIFIYKEIDFPLPSMDH